MLVHQRVSESHPNPWSQRLIFNTHAEHAEQPAARFTPAEPNLSGMSGWKTSLIEISSRYKPSMYIYIYVCVYMYVYIYIYKYN